MWDVEYVRPHWKQGEVRAPEPTAIEHFLAVDTPFSALFDPFGR
jgi:hypothetical protein